LLVVESLGNYRGTTDKGRSFGTLIYTTESIAIALPGNQRFRHWVFCRLKVSVRICQIRRLTFELRRM